MEESTAPRIPSVEDDPRPDAETTPDAAPATETAAHDAGDAATDAPAAASEEETPPAETGAESPEAAEDAPPAPEDEDGASADDPAAHLPLAGVVEALLFTSPDPLSAKALAKAAGQGVKPADVEAAIAELAAAYEANGRAFEIAHVRGAHRLVTRPEYAAVLRPAKADEDAPRRLSPAALETLSVIAYRQPVLRVDIEAIRGVGCGPMLRQLIELDLVRVVGRKTDVIGQPMLYGTTDRFLEAFGLAGLDRLPDAEALRRPAAALSSPVDADGDDASDAAAANGREAVDDDDGGNEDSPDEENGAEEADARQAAAENPSEATDDA